MSADSKLLTDTCLRSRSWVTGPPAPISMGSRGWVIGSTGILRGAVGMGEALSSAKFLETNEATSTLLWDRPGHVWWGSFFLGAGAGMFPICWKGDEVMSTLGAGAGFLSSTWGSTVTMSCTGREGAEVVTTLGAGAGIFSLVWGSAETMSGTEAGLVLDKESCVSSSHQERPLSTSSVHVSL